MEERFVEIRFVYFIKKLFNRFKYSVQTLQLIEAYGNLAGVNLCILNKLIKQVRDNNGIINTYKEEAVYIARQVGISYRILEKETGVSIATQVRLNKYYEEHPNMYKELGPHLNQEEHEVVYRFMKVVDMFKEL